MKIPNIRTRNFTLSEIMHRDKEITQEKIYSGLVRMGYMQGFSDFLYYKYGRHIRLKITSGNRELTYNRSIGSSDRSHHVYRIDDNYVICANDLVSPDLKLEKLYKDFADFSRGETYMHKRFKFVHNSLHGKNEQWIQG